MRTPSRDSVAVPTPPVAFARVVVVAGDRLPVQVDAVVPGANPLVMCATVDARGRLLVREAIRAARRLDVRGPIAILTSRDLCYPGCDSLTGFADRQKQVLVVSTARLDPAARPDLLLRRLRNVLAHEAAHLAGARHCDEPACLMRPAKSPGEIDGRSFQLCGDCAQPTSRSGLKPLKSALVLLGAAALLSGAVGMIGKPLQAPFT